MYKFTISYRPLPWAAPTFSKHGVYDIRAREKLAIRYILKQSYDLDPLDEIIILKFKFIFKFPANISKKRKALILAEEIIPTRCDCTNMQKLYEDCLKGIVIKDDRKVAKIFSEKLYGERDEVIIEVHTLKEFKNASDT